MVKKLKCSLILIASSLGLSFTIPAVTSIAQTLLKINNANEKIYITFDPNGGSLSGSGNKILEFETNKEFKDLQNVPTVSRDGVIEQPGWINADTSEVITDTTTFTSSCTLKANWKLYNVTFDGNGGLIDGKQTKAFSKVSVIHSDDIVAPIKENYTFTGWKEDGSSNYITFPYKPSKNVAIKACYTNAENVTLSFAANGGKFSGGTFDGKIFASTTIPFGTTWENVKNSLIPVSDPVINKDLVFSSWQLDDNEIDDNYTFTKTTLVKANYVSGIQVTFDVATNGGTWDNGSSASLVSNKIKLSNNPSLKDFKDSLGESFTTPKKGAIELLGWFLDKDANGGKLDLNSASPITNKASFTIYAYYKVTHNITFTLDTGVKTKETYPSTFCRKDNLTYQFEQESGYTLLNDDHHIAVKVNGNKITKGVDYTFNVSSGTGTLNIPDAPDNDIEVIINVDINSYSINLAALPKGVNAIKVTGSGEYNEDISFAVDVADGYTLSSLKMKNNNTSAETDITDTKIFKMPDSNVTITATATTNSYSITAVTTVDGLDVLTVNSSANYLDEVTVTATVKAGYTLTNIKIIKDDSATAIDTIQSGGKFTMPAVNVTVLPVISVNSYELTLDANGGTLSSTNKINVTYNESILDAIGGASINDPTHEDSLFKGWGESTSSQEVMTSENKMPASNKTIYAIWYKYNFEFISSDSATVTGVTTYSEKYKLSKDDFSTSTTITANPGYALTGEYEIYFDEEESPRLTTSFINPLKPGKVSNPLKKDATIKIKPLTEVTLFQATFNFNGGSIKKNEYPISSYPINCGENVLNSLYGVTATHDYQVFKNWQMIKEDGTAIDVDDTTTAPSCNITIKPLWKTATINLSAIKGTITGTTPTLLNKTIFYDREGFGITPDDGYTFSHYEYSFDNANFTKIENLPFKPFVVNPELSHGATIYIRAVCIKYINIWLYGNGGTFASGNNYECVSIISGQKWIDIKTSLPTPVLAGRVFQKWVNSQTGADISDNDIIESTTILKAIFVGGE